MVCVAARRANTQHRSMADAPPRTVPVLHLDYCFPRDDSSEEAMTVLVGKLMLAGDKGNNGSTLVVPVVVKGPQDQHGFHCDER